ncbi:MAG: hypothetical protein IPN97_04965 [Saprospiraceae bacterium]|nr:hypothetical protein [Saprospiraceae bacterium]
MKIYAGYTLYGFCIGYSCTREGNSSNSGRKRHNGFAQAVPVNSLLYDADDAFSERNPQETTSTR